jgi:hypothetical protein
MAKRSSFAIEPEDVERLEELARIHGYVQTRGPGKGQGLGSISALLRAIARGDIRLVGVQRQEGQPINEVVDEEQRHGPSDR